jgi:flagellar hook-associated protein 2
MAITPTSTGSSTTSTSSTKTGTAATKSAAQSAAAALVKSLGTGSDIDLGALVPSLVEAQFAAKRAQLTKKQEAVTAQISGVSTVTSNIKLFTKSLKTLVSDGSLQSQPVSSSPTTLTAAATAGAKLAGRTASVRVDKLAMAQNAVTKVPFASSSATVGKGTLTLSIGTGEYDSTGKLTALPKSGTTATTVEITIGDDNQTLSGIAAAINAKKAGVTASVVTDADGKAYLSLRGTTGAAQAFTLSSTSTDGDLSQLDVGPAATNSTITQTARNAELNVDGVDIQRGSNEISDAIEGMKLTLVAPSTTAVTLTTTTPTTALTNAINDFVETFNQIMELVKEQNDPVTGALKSDPAMRQLATGLRQLTGKVLLPNAAAGEPSTLSAIGVRLEKDGTLSVDKTKLAEALEKTPGAVEAMLAAPVKNATTPSGLYSAMESLDFNTSSTVYGLGASGTRYASASKTLAKDDAKMSDAEEKMTTRLTKQFSAMNSRVSAFKATQAYMKQQIDMWTKSE